MGLQKSYPFTVLRFPLTDGQGDGNEHISQMDGHRISDSYGGKSKLAIG